MNAQAEVSNQDVFGVEDGSPDDQSSEAGEN